MGGGGSGEHEGNSRLEEHKDIEHRQEVSPVHQFTSELRLHFFSFTACSLTHTHPHTHTHTHKTYRDYVCVHTLMRTGRLKREAKANPAKVLT